VTGCSFLPCHPCSTRVVHDKKRSQLEQEPHGRKKECVGSKGGARIVGESDEGDQIVEKDVSLKRGNLRIREIGEKKSCQVRGKKNENGGQKKGGGKNVFGSFRR